jgi:hypothetical protein
MSEANAIPNLPERQLQADFIPGSLFDWGAGPLLNAQADILAGAETTLTDWLRRRHEAVVDTRQLIACLHPGTDPGEALKAQRDWLSRSLRRMAADAEAYQSASQQLLERAPDWFPRSAWPWLPRNGGGTATPSSQAAATRAAGQPLRMANKPD